jgi:peptidyl-prolyl cis-trans isomerase C
MPTATARHILVPTEADANELLESLRGGADFAELARENSGCPSGEDGGQLGSFQPGMMVKEFDEVVFSAAVGVAVGPVQTQFGYHVIEVTSRDD